MRLIILCIILIAALSGCKKEHTGIISYWNCNKSLNLDSAGISLRLLGTWSWTKQSCGGTGEFRSADKNITIQFNSDQSFRVADNGSTITQGTWAVQPKDGNSWGLNLSSSSEYLHGYILFCGNEVFFNNSYLDGCDNLFVKN